MFKRQFNGFYNQRIEYKNITSRKDYFVDKIKDKKCLHIGCADWPVYNEATNLHLFLCSHSSTIDGYDPEKTTIKNMIDSKRFPENSLFDTLPDKKYDIIIAPETIEHVLDMQKFFLSLTSVVDKKIEIIVTAPNCFRSDAPYRDTGEVWIEEVHPDHNCWFSLFTLPNVAKKSYEDSEYSLSFKEIGTLENKSMVFFHGELEKND